MAGLPANKNIEGVSMLTPFVTALVVGNCMAGFCLVGSVALVCGATGPKKISATGLDLGVSATNSFSGWAGGTGRPFDNR
jgi:hypothetical protein